MWTGAMTDTRCRAKSFSSFEHGTRRTPVIGKVLCTFERFAAFAARLRSRLCCWSGQWSGHCGHLFARSLVFVPQFLPGGRVWQSADSNVGLGFYATKSDRRNLVPPTTLVLTSQARSFPGEIAGFRDCSVGGLFCSESSTVPSWSVVPSSAYPGLRVWAQSALSWNFTGLQELGYHVG